MELAEMIFEIVVYGKVADQTIRGTFQARPFKRPRPRGANSAMYRTYLPT